MRTETVEVIGWFGKEYEGTYVFGEISWAKRNRIIQKYTKYHPLTGQVVSSDYVAVQAETIWASLKEQPENSPISLEKLLSDDDGVPFELGELFSQTVNGLCNVSVDETRFLSEQSDAENRTPRSRSLGSAKSSGSRQKSSGSSRRKQSKPLC